MAGPQPHPFLVDHRPPHPPHRPDTGWMADYRGLYGSRGVVRRGILRRTRQVLPHGDQPQPREPGLAHPLSEARRVPRAVSGRDRQVAQRPEETFARPEETFARRMRELREQVGMSQAHVATVLQTQYGIKVDPTAITCIYLGSRTIRLDDAVAIAAVLDLTVNEVLQPVLPPDEQLMQVEEQLEPARWRAARSVAENEVAQRRLERLRSRLLTGCRSDGCIQGGRRRWQALTSARTADGAPGTGTRPAVNTLATSPGK